MAEGGSCAELLLATVGMNQANTIDMTLKLA